MWKSVLITAVGALAVAGCGRGGGDRIERMSQVVSWKVDDALDALDATEAQRGQVGQIKDRLLVEAPALAQGGEKARAALLEQWSSPKPDAARVHAIVDERIEAFRAMAHKVADAAIEVHGILTPEQRKQVASRIERARSR